MLAKIDTEIFWQMVADGLDLDAVYLHIGTILWLYGAERDDCYVHVKIVRRKVAPAFDTDEQADVAAQALVDAGYWAQQGSDGFVLIDHADVIRREIGNHKSLRARNRDSVNGRCQACGTTEKLTVDHIYPQTLGGCSEMCNLQALCRPCNSSKGGRLLPGVSCCGVRDQRCDGLDNVTPIRAPRSSPAAEAKWAAGYDR